MAFYSNILSLLLLSFLLFAYSNGSDPAPAINKTCATALTRNSSTHHLASYIGYVSDRFVGTHKDKAYEYKIGVCVAPDPDLPDCGIVQYDTNSTKTHCIGRITSPQVTETDDHVWVELTYTHGDQYNTHCSKEHRRGRLTFLCDTLITGQGHFDFLEESNTEELCYYLFALASKQVCGSQLTAGDIILILAFCLAVAWAVFMVAGCLFKRFITGAKGWDQVPGLDYYIEFGRLEADGCDFVCRYSRSKTSSSVSRPAPVFETDDETTDEEKDDNLLPM